MVTTKLNKPTAIIKTNAKEINRFGYKALPLWSSDTLEIPLRIIVPIAPADKAGMAML
ncbi:hypothetical protein [Methylophaga sp.]|uniref:hypothetical protein n=1 Tax=Methylophaga sp. TaxID=2024840 RepID=UPI0026005B28|nr:hypothetical protein [Methylophaga sp.]